MRALSDLYVDTEFTHSSLNLEEGNKVAIRFCEDNETHHLLWTELLTVDLELPFEKYEDLKVGTKVMAPWYTPDDDISFSEAFVVSDEPEKKGRCILVKATVHVR